MNLDQQLDDVTQTLMAYWRASWRLSLSSAKVSLRRPWTTVRQGFRFMLEGFFRRDYVSGRRTDSEQTMLRSLLAASAAELEPDVRDDLESPYPLNAIAHRLVTRFPQCDFAKLRRLHEVRRANRFKYGFGAMLGVALAALAFVGKSVPSTIVEKYLEVPNEAFQESLFYLSLGCVAYLGLFVVIEWARVVKHDFIAELLTYAELVSRQ